MALLNDLIRKYEIEAKDRINEAKRRNGTLGEPVGNRDDIFLKIDTPRLADLHETGVKPGLGTGSIWKAKPMSVDVQKGLTAELKQQVQYTPQPKQASYDQILEELQNLRNENAELKAKLGIVKIDA